MSSVSAVETAPVRRRRSPLAVAICLGRFEGRKLLKHPISVVGALGSLAIPVAVSWSRLPVLNRYDAHTNEALIPFAAAILISAQLSTMRARRNRTTELFESTPVSEGAVVGAHLFAVAHAAVTALVLVMIQLAYLKVIGGPTTPRLPVVLIGPALVAFGGAFGVAVGRWTPRLFAGPVAIAGLVAVCTALTTNTFAHDREWLSLWVLSEPLTGAVSEVSMRPYGWRLLYICTLVLGAVALAVGHLQSRRIIAIALIVVAATGAVITGHRAMERAPRGEQVLVAARLMEGLKHPVCEEDASVEYCPLPGYEGWIDIWRRPTEGVLVAAPPEARPTNLRFLQAPSDAETYDERANYVLTRQLRRARRRGVLSSENEIHPSLSWGRNSRAGESELAVALEVAARVTGIDARFRLTKPDIDLIPKRLRRGFRPGVHRSCTVLEQGRSIVTMWFAAQATDDTRVAFRRAVDRNPFLSQPLPDGSGYFDPLQWGLTDYSWNTLGESAITWGTRESAYALALLQRDPSEVRGLVAANWTRIMNPTATTDEVASMLALEPLLPMRDALKNWKLGGSYRHVESFGVPRCR